MPWVWLIIAGLFEVGWAVGLKYSNGLTRPWVSLTTVIVMILSFVFLALAMRALPVSTAYPAWTGIGAVGTVVLGVVLFGEAATLARLACIVLIIAGVVGLRLLSPV